MKSVERSSTSGGGSGQGDTTHSIALTPLVALNGLHGAHLHSWAFLTFIPLHPTSSWGKTSQTGQVSESLDSTWQLCAVGHGSHSPRAAPEHVRQAGATLDVEITQKISRLTVKEGCQGAHWVLGNF